MRFIIISQHPPLGEAFLGIPGILKFKSPSASWKNFLGIGDLKKKGFPRISVIN